MISVGIFTLRGEFTSTVASTSYLLQILNVLVRFPLYCSTICMVDGLRMDGLVRVVVHASIASWWMVCEWMAWSGMLYMHL